MVGAVLHDAKGRIASLKMLPDDFPVVSEAELPNQFGGGYGRDDQHARKARDHISAAGALSGERRLEKARILDELCAVTGWHRKHAIRALPVDGASGSAVPRRRGRTYGASIRVALIVLWDASDRLCSKRLVAMIPFCFPLLNGTAD